MNNSIESYAFRKIGREEQDKRNEYLLSLRRQIPSFTKVSWWSNNRLWVAIYTQLGKISIAPGGLMMEGKYKVLEAMQ